MLSGNNIPKIPKKRKERSKRKHTVKNQNKLPEEIIILILLHTKTNTHPMVRTCKHFLEFVDTPDSDYNFWSILTRHMFDCELTHDEYLVKQICSCESLGSMMLLKYIIASVGPIKILFDKNNMPISDLLIYITLPNCIWLRIVHKNQFECP